MATRLDAAPAGRLAAELGAIAGRAGLMKRGEPDWAALAAACGLSAATMRAVVHERVRPEIPFLLAVAIFAQAYDPAYSRLRLVVAAGWLTEEDIVRYVRERLGVDEESLAMARRLIALLRTPGVLDRLRQIDSPAARELLDMARQLGLEGSGPPGPRPPDERPQEGEEDR